MTTTQTPIQLQIYSIWRPGVGWLKTGEKILAFSLPEVAHDTADILGDGARVVCVDESAPALEAAFLAAERKRLSRPWWRKVI